MSLHFTIVTVLTALILAWVGIRGGTPERWGAVVVGARYVLDMIYHWAWTVPTFFAVDPGHAAMDSLMLAVLVWLTLEANRVWPVWMAAGALVAVLGHLMMLTGKDSVTPAYWATTNGPHYVQLLALLLGTLFHRWRLRRVGPYRDWS